jgi:hypothetical protein
MFLVGPKVFIFVVKGILMISDNVEFLPLIFYAVFWQPF